MIVKSENSKLKEFKGVKFEVLANSPNLMLTKMLYTAGQKVPFHSHPQEQCGYVISGEHILQYGDVKEKLFPGDSYCIPGGVKHAWEVLKEGEAIDVFNPPRTDYL